MAVKGNDLAALFNQQRELNAEQVRISQELALINQKILYVLATAANLAGEMTARAPDVKTIAHSTENGSGGRRSWFERGESLKLMRRVAKRAMRPAQVVHAVMDAKGYSTTLSSQDKKRVQAALHQAVITAVKAGSLTRNAQGLVRVKA